MKWYWQVFIALVLIFCGINIIWLVNQKAIIPKAIITHDTITVYKDTLRIKEYPNIIAMETRFIQAVDSVRVEWMDGGEHYDKLWHSDVPNYYSHIFSDTLEAQSFACEKLKQGVNVKISAMPGNHNIDAFNTWLKKQ